MKQAQKTRLGMFMAVLVFVVAVVAFPNSPWSTQLFAQTYPVTNIKGHTWIFDNEVIYSGYTFGVPTGSGLIPISLTEKQLIGTVYLGGADLVVDARRLSAEIARLIRLRRFTDNKPEDQSPETVRLMQAVTAPNGREARLYYLFTNEGTRVFQVNLYFNGKLENDRLKIFIEDGAGTTAKPDAKVWWAYPR